MIISRGRRAIVEVIMMNKLRSYGRVMRREDDSVVNVTLRMKMMGIVETERKAKVTMAQRHQQPAAGKEYQPQEY